MASCQLCKRSCAPASTLCKYHLLARRNIDAAYKRWAEAYGSMGWPEYLEKVIASPETGSWAKEVAQLLAKEGGRADA